MAAGVGDKERSQGSGVAANSHQAIRGCADLASLWRRISGQFPHAELEQVVGVALKALGADLEVQGVCVDRVRFGWVIKEMAQLRALLGVREQVDLLLRGLRGEAVVGAAEVTEMMGQFIALCGMRGAEVDDVQRLERFLGVRSAVGKAQFYQAITQSIRRAPLVLFRNDEQRLILLAACQSALDRAIGAEQENRVVNEAHYVG
ncbi:TyeA family type III secretion system gatekeeper subunit [Pseudomonas plecoglossicida]|nr:TyeA family type III secretion system gatekeeper subunit [Pseudomonas plecoglossicida]EPB94347.1 type iii secretion control protein sctw [Pseudomonas plecoglossicida NB2011]QLB56289.1 TyeA family type III secretion system gatekeeper subunit [Pseudomonas plecoglossicida]GLR37900.1 hypothetical protein GCM10011247_32980 [Pseudomonas plecoglossicida]